MTEIFIERTDPALPEAAGLIQELDEHLIALYPPENSYRLSIDALRQSHIVFVTARLTDAEGGNRIACGALVNHGGEYGELKRMYVQPAYRGQGVAYRIIQALEDQARAVGLSVLRLETGTLQTEAMRLYEKAGYADRSAFGDYRASPLNRFMEKRLS